jgi:hypothetical protein
VGCVRRLIRFSKSPNHGQSVIPRGYTPLGEGSNPTTAESMENEEKPDRSNVHYIALPERPKRLVSRTRLVMGLLLIVAIPIFIGLANKAVHENAEAIQQSFGQ